MGLLLFFGAKSIYDLKIPIDVLSFPAFFLFAGLSFILSELKRMPFRVYNNGITSKWVPLLKGIKREEVFIKLEDVMKVDVHAAKYFDDLIFYIFIEYRDEKGRSKRMALREDDIDNILPVYRVLKRIKPDAIVEPLTLGRMEEPSHQEMWLKKYRSVLTVGELYFLLIFLAVPIITGVILGLGDEINRSVPIYNELLFNVLISVLFIVLASVSFLFLERNRIQSTSFHGDRILLHPHPIPLILIDIQREIEVSSIHEVRRCLRPGSSLVTTSIIMTNGEKWYTDRNLFEVVYSSDGFIGDIYSQRPKHAIRNYNIKTISINIIKVIFMIGILNIVREIVLQFVF